MSTSATTPTPTPAPGPSGRAGRRWSAARRDNRDGWLLVSPTVIVVVAIVVIPVLWNVVLAFQKLSFLQIRRAGIDGPYTLENFRRVLTSAGFLESMWTTVVYSVGSTAGSIVLGLIAALALRNRFPGRGVAGRRGVGEPRVGETRGWSPCAEATTSFQDRGWGWGTDRWLTGTRWASGRRWRRGRR